MLHKIEAEVARKEDNKGNPIPRAKLKFRTISFSVFSKDPSEVMKKAGQRITADGYIVGNIKLVKTKHY
jgi:hypothetical protein